jgi:hypothetical protein
VYLTYMASVETDASARTLSVRPSHVALAAAGVAAAAAAGLLWWRFGDRVYAISLMEAILACF